MFDDVKPLEKMLELVRKRKDVQPDKDNQCNKTD